MNIDEMLTHIRELEARAENAEHAFLAALKTMSDEARKRGEAEGRLAASEMAGVVDGWKARAEAAEAKVAKLRETLKPFARRASQLNGLWKNHETHWSPEYGSTGITIGDLRAAMKAMEATDE